MSATVNLNGQSKLDAFRDPQPVQVSKQRCDTVVLPCFINKVCRSVQHGLKAVHQVSRNARQGRAAIVKLCRGQRSVSLCLYRLGCVTQTSYWTTSTNVSHQKPPELLSSNITNVNKYKREPFYRFALQYSGSSAEVGVQLKSTQLIGIHLVH